MWSDLVVTNRDARRVLLLILDPLPPEIRGWYRAAGSCICPICNFEYRLHPIDPNDEFLHVLCTGDRVKL